MHRRARPLLCGILVVLLVLLQHGALLHGFAHERHAAGHETELVDQDLVHDGLCEVCLAYAVIGGAPPAALPNGFVALAESRPLRRQSAFVAAAAAGYAARAPPFLLV